MTGRPTVETILVARYRCRDEEGGCGARTGERCKTHLRGRITQPHQDRWTQWHLAGSPGAWWHGEDGRDGYQRQPPVGSREDLLDGIEKSLALIEANVAELRRLDARQ